MVETLVLYHPTYHDKILKELEGNGDSHNHFLNISPYPTPDFCKRFEDYMIGPQLKAMDRHLYEFARSWYKDNTDFQQLHLNIKLWLATPIKVLNVLLITKPQRIVMVNTDYLLRSVVQSYANEFGVKLTVIPTGHKMHVTVPVPADNMNPTERKLNDQIILDSRHDTRKKILYQMSVQSMMDLPAISKSDKISVIGFSKHNKIHPDILGKFPFVMLPSRPTPESTAYPIDMYNKLFSDYEWQRDLNMLGIRLNDDFLSIFPDYVCSAMCRFLDIHKWLEQVVKEWDIKAICIGQDTMSDERAIVLAAKKLEVPTVVMQHGAYADRYPWYEPPLADHVCAWGVISLEQLIKLDERYSGNACNVNQFRVVGTQRFKLLKQYHDEADVPRVRAQLKIPDGKKVTLFCAQPYLGFYAYWSPYEMNELLVSIMEKFKAKPDEVLIIRLHPFTHYSEDPSIKHEIMAKHAAPNVVVDPGLDLWDTMSVVDEVISHDSTTMWEASYIGKSVREVSLPGKKNMMDFDPLVSLVEDESGKGLCRLLEEITG